MNVKIIADSTCDLNPELIEQYAIDIIPLHVVLGEETFEDGVNITSPEVIDWANQHKATPKTAAPSVKVFVDAFQPYVDAGQPVLCLTIGSEFSATYQSAKLAADNFQAAEVQVFDTQNLSSGGGHLVLIAAEMAQAGHSLAEIVAKLEEVRPKVRASFFVDTMTFLYRGGRCSAVAAISATALQIKPQIVVMDGKMDVGRKFRGSTLKVCKSYCEAVLKDIERIDPKRVFVTVSPSDPVLVETAREIVASKHYFEEIIVTYAGSVITSHCGENTLGVLYIEK
ncbi:MAG: DegV family protein [Anaerolineae bacterium]|jgi:DegV family protein with EDD domain|nr:DegV family protein [Anaerolineae bacterium]